MTTRPIPGDLFDRAQLTNGLRALADYLDDHPDLPVPEYGGQINFYPSGTETQQRAEIDKIARILDVTPTDDTDRGGHYTAAKSFGRVAYRAVCIPARAWARHQAENSYRPNITPDNPQEDGHAGHVDNEDVAA